INTDANETVRPVHDRMPVVLPPELFNAWLGAGGEAADLLPPSPADWWTATPVPPRSTTPRRMTRRALLRCECRSMALSAAPTWCRYTPCRCGRPNNGSARHFAPCGILAAFAVEIGSGIGSSTEKKNTRK